ncbi:hypothetical protein IV203_035407 [Nitzschia inconspicua]|uniref:Uncharacterized protein n=1 Tax=Nitzschia inconspicua TaxID=303405 RepID=A0A9K3LE48_9STRA|nr:hypothetical protein IV203_035407 [Nitzschia inconspicua]
MTDCSLLVARSECERVGKQAVQRNQLQNVPEQNEGCPLILEQGRPHGSHDFNRTSQAVSVCQNMKRVLHVSDSSMSNAMESVDRGDNNNNNNAVDAEIIRCKNEDAESSERVVSPDADFEPDGIASKNSREQGDLEAPSSKKIKMTLDSSARHDRAGRTTNRGLVIRPQDELQESQIHPKTNSKKGDTALDSSVQSTPITQKKTHHSVHSFSDASQQQEPYQQMTGPKPSDPAGPKQPPAYSLTPQLLEKAKSRLNKSLQPDQIPSHRFLENFHQRQRERRKQKRQIQNPQEKKLKQDFVLLSPTRFQNLDRPQYFKEAFARLGYDYLHRCQPLWQDRNLLPAIQMLANGVNHFNQHHFSNNFVMRPVSPSKERKNAYHQGQLPPSFPTSCVTTLTNPPGPQSYQEMNSIGDALPHEQLLQRENDVDQHGNVDHDIDEVVAVPVHILTNRGKGQEWTCVFSVSGAWELGFDPDISLEQNFNRLIGYRMQFDGTDQGLNPKEAGETARILPPRDERTRRVTAMAGKMEGTLERRSDVVSCHPDSDYEPVLCYGWRPDKEGFEEVYGLDDYWSDWMATLDEAEQKAHFVDVTIEGCTAVQNYNWRESFPFGDLFGKDPQGSNRVPRDKLKDRYWRNGIIVLFHWEYDVAEDQVDNGHKEFALFVPSSHVFAGDDAIHTSVVQRNDEDDGSRSPDERNGSVTL